ncbi:DUF1778 domain-containing protein [Pseudanabaena sp. UWO310]|uniref:type II toxin-antitoxin system TacA family antitoxin n=1 Tax=Pseudanabaena sp. UWO310 TaxID=2480795 RepID=UPI001160D283|nr:DUF1778 domain-containing protein [Pseudanabaena sp. UWO310]TYQ25373.1 DUF1778 domain-containing protein [Pseudanabaena sp. UWO310]
MANTSQAKLTARLEARISPEIKAVLQKAADLEGRSLTDFVVASLHKAACQVIEQHQILKLSIEDSEAFVKALASAPAPNENLQAAALRYKQVMSS